MSEEDADDRQHEASQKRLESLRAEGRIARSPEALSAISLVSFCLGAVLLGPAVTEGVSLRLMRLLSAEAGAGWAGTLRPTELALSLGGEIAPLFLPPLMAVVLAVTVMRGWTFTPKNLEPRLSRISPLAAAGHKFGVQGLFDFGRNLAKLAATAIAAVWFVRSHLNAIMGAAQLQDRQIAFVIFDLAMDFLILSAALGLVFGGADYLWQVLRHRRQAMMTRQEMTEEHKESEGDPHFRAHRRQRGQEIALNRMLQVVPEADVVVVNPTHYAVALKWNRKDRRAPVCVAKGQDEIAARIRERAIEAGVPIHRDPPTARALHAALDVGDEIGREHYQAVAAAIRFAEAMRKKARRR